MAPRWDELKVDTDGFFPFLKAGFAQKRKTLGKNLRTAGFDPAAVATALEKYGISPNARAEELPLETSANLYRELRSAP
jgi:16S rRNA (adenine1518-N6/adenine1519-N6)-dimethyltransferase